MPRDIPGEALWLRVPDEGTAVAIGSVGRGAERTSCVLSLPTGGPSIARGGGPLPRSSASTSPACGPWRSIGRAVAHVRARARHLPARPRGPGQGPPDRLGTMAACATCCWTPRSGGCFPSTRPASFASGCYPRGHASAPCARSPPQRFTLPSFDRDGEACGLGVGGRGARLGPRRPARRAPPSPPRGDVADVGEPAFTRDGRWLAAGSSGAPRCSRCGFRTPGRCGAHLEGPLAFAFTPDSRLLVSCAQDGARMWPFGARGGCDTSYRTGGRLLLLRSRGGSQRAGARRRLAVHGDLLACRSAAARRARSSTSPAGGSR